MRDKCVRSASARKMRITSKEILPFLLACTSLLSFPVIAADDLRMYCPTGSFTRSSNGWVATRHAGTGKAVFRASRKEMAIDAKAGSAQANLEARLAAKGDLARALARTTRTKNVPNFSGASAAWVNCGFSAVYVFSVDPQSIHWEADTATTNTTDIILDDRLNFDTDEFIKDALN